MAIKAKAKCKCPKCDGTGHIQAFSGIAGGVCFMCEGNGTLNYIPTPRKTWTPSPGIRSQMDRILDGAFDGLGYDQLLWLRDLCCSAGIVNDYPEVRKAWLAKGEDLFFAAQEEQIAEWDNGPRNAYQGSGK